MVRLPSLLHLLKPIACRAADSALLRGFSIYSIAANLAHIIGLIRGRLAFLDGLESILKIAIMDSLHLIGILKSTLSPHVILQLRPVDKNRIHPGELLVLPDAGRQQVIPGRANRIHGIEVISGVYCFRLGYGPEQPGYLRIAFLIGLFRKKLVTAVGLAFPGEGFLQVSLCLYLNTILLVSESLYW